MGRKATGIYLGRRAISNRILPRFYYHEREPQQGATGKTKDSLENLLISKCSKNPCILLDN